MWILQNILFVVGSTALGMLLGVIMWWVMFENFLMNPGEEPMGRGFGLLLGGLLFGAPLGAVVGLIGSIYCVFRQYQRGTWCGVVWWGILFGLLMSISDPMQSIHIVRNLSQAYGWEGATCFTMACGTAGGMLASMGLAIYRFAKKARTH